MKKSKENTAQFLLGKNVRIFPTVAHQSPALGKLLSVSPAYDCTIESVTPDNRTVTTYINGAHVLAIEAVH